MKLRHCLEEIRIIFFASAFSNDWQKGTSFLKSIMSSNCFLVAAILIGTIGSPNFGFCGDKVPKKQVLDKLKFSSDSEQGNDRRAMKAEILIAKSESLALKQIGKLLRKYKGTSVEPGLWFRLSELYMRKARTDKFFEWNRKSSGVLRFSAPYLKKASSKKWVKKAIAVYEKIARKFPQFEKMDVVLFNNAFARQGLGQDGAAVDRYEQVIARYPHSSLVPDSHLAIGEAVFDKKRFTVAKVHFEAIKKYPNSRVYPYGLYKSAWTYYNLRNTKKGLGELEAVIEYGKLISEKGLDRRLDLRIEALADMTIFFEDVYTSKKALSYFVEQSGDLEATPYLMKLVVLYKRHSKFKAAGVVLKDLTKSFFDSSLIPEVYEEIVYNYESQRNRKNAVASLIEFSDICSEQKKWMKIQKTKTPSQYIEIVKTCKDRLDTQSLILGQKWLRMWTKNSTYKVFASSAEAAFTVYLTDKPVNKKVNKTRFVFAELLYNQKKYRKSSFEYEKVGDVTKGNHKQKHRSQYAAVLSLEKAVGKGKWSDIDELRFAILVNKYVKAHKRGKFLLGVKFQRALIAYDKGNYKIAKPIFRTLGEKFSNKDKGIKSQDLYLDILNLEKNYAGLKAYAQKLRKRGGSKARLSKLSIIFEEAYFIEVQVDQEQGRKKEAILGYKNFVRDNPKSKLIEKAWWNAVALHFEIEDQLGGAKASLQFHHRFPASKNALAALKKAANTYQVLGQLSKSADVMIKISLVDSLAQLKWQALAADMYYLEGRWKRAGQLYKKISQSKNRMLSLGAFVKLVEIEKRKGLFDHKSLRKIETMNQQPQSSLALLQILEKEYKSKNFPKSFQTARKIVAMKQGAIHARGRARFIQGEILEKEFRRQGMRTNVARFALVLALKTEKLDKAQRAYQAAIAIGDPSVAVKSLVKLSGCYSHYATALQSMPLPKGITTEEAVPFKNEIGKMAFPMEERSVETLNEAYVTAKRLHLRDGTIENLRQQLEKLQIKVPHGPMFVVDSPQLVVPNPKRKGILVGGLRR